MNRAGASSSSRLELVAPVLERAQRLGMLGERPIPEVIEHARRFAVALDGIDGSVVDLGSGGGVPGLIIAALRPDLAVTLLDRRRRRTDFLHQMVSRLGWGEQVAVVCEDADRFAETEDFDAVVARGFGPPRSTLRTAVALARPGAIIAISDPPDRDRWNDDDLTALPVQRSNVDIPALAVFRLKPSDG